MKFCKKCDTHSSPPPWLINNTEVVNICEGRVGMLIWTRVVKDFMTYLIDQRPSSEASKSYSTQEIPYS